MDYSADNFPRYSGCSSKTQESESELVATICEDPPRGVEGCVCSPLPDMPFSRKCGVCLLQRIEGKISPGCVCVTPAPYFYKTGTCLGCNLPNYNLLATVRAAVGRVIRQHFLFEHKPNSEDLKKYLRVGGPTGRKDARCRLCKPAPLIRRFGTTPPRLRECMERAVLQDCIQAENHVEKKDVAIRKAEECVHYWMDHFIKIVESRRRKSPYKPYDSTKFSFSYYNPANDK